MSSIKSSPRSIKRGSSILHNFASPPSLSEYKGYKIKYRKVEETDENQFTDSDHEIPCGQRSYLPGYGTPKSRLHLDASMLKFEEEDRIIRFYNSDSSYEVIPDSQQNSAEHSRNPSVSRAGSTVEYKITLNPYQGIDNVNINQDQRFEALKLLPVNGEEDVIESISVSEAAENSAGFRKTGSSVHNDNIDDNETCMTETPDHIEEIVSENSTLLTTKDPAYCNSIDADEESVDISLSRTDRPAKSKGETPPESDNEDPFKMRLKFRVVPQHRVERCLQRYTKRKDRETVKELGIHMMKGKFRKTEDEIISQAWKKFLKEYDIADGTLFLKSLSSAKFSNKHKLRFVRYLARKLPQRFLGRVYNRFLQLFVSHRKRQGRFTKEEDEIIMKYVEKDERGWKNIAKVAEILNRTDVSVTVHMYKKLANKKIIKRKWTLKDVENILGIMFKIFNAEDIMYFKDKEIPKKVWNKIGKILNIKSKSIKNFWLYKLHQQLFAESPIYLSEIRIKLILLFQQSEVKCFEDINWVEVSEHFVDLRPFFLKWTFKLLLSRNVPYHKRKSFTATLNHLVNVVLPILQKKTKYDRRLLWIVYDPILGKARFVQGLSFSDRLLRSASKSEVPKSVKRRFKKTS